MWSAVCGDCGPDMAFVSSKNIGRVVHEWRFSELYKAKLQRWGPYTPRKCKCKGHHPIHFKHHPSSASSTKPHPCATIRNALGESHKKAQRVFAFDGACGWPGRRRLQEWQCIFLHAAGLRQRAASMPPTQSNAGSGGEEPGGASWGPPYQT